MKLREFIGKVTGSSAVREIVPCNQNLLYPQFSVSRRLLCLHFIGHTAAVLEDGLLIGVPEVYLQVSYPRSEILGYQNLKYSPGFAGTDFTRTTLLPNRTPEERARRRDAMVRLEAMGDAVLEAWDQALELAEDDFPELLERGGEMLTKEGFSVLERYGETLAKDGFPELLEQYGEMLAEVLEPEQMTAYDRLLRMK